jgi:multidrug efflux pump subunit AcrA (membrane-fusion protein)
MGTTKAELEQELEAAQAEIARLTDELAAVEADAKVRIDAANAAAEEARTAASQAVAGEVQLVEVAPGELEKQNTPVTWVGAEGFEEYHSHDGEGREVHIGEGETVLVSASKASQLASDFGGLIEVGEPVEDEEEDD